MSKCLHLCICLNVFFFCLQFYTPFAIFANLSFSLFSLFLFFLRQTKWTIHARDQCRRLRTELQLIRHKGSLNINGDIGGGSLDRQNIVTYLTCARCCTELGRIINRGAPCRVCRLRVCKSCREFSTRPTDWACIVCHKQM